MKIEVARHGEHRRNRLHEGLAEGRFRLPRYRRRNCEIAELQLRAWSTGIGPAGVLIGFVVLKTCHMRASIIGSPRQNVDLIVRLWPMLGGIKRAVRTEVEPLRITVTVSKNMADNAVKLRIVRRH